MSRPVKWEDLDAEDRQRAGSGMAYTAAASLAGAVLPWVGEPAGGLAMCAVGLYGTFRVLYFTGQAVDRARARQQW